MPRPGCAYHLLDKGIIDQGDDLTRHLRAKENPMRSIPDVGPTTAVTMLAKCWYLGTLNRREIAGLIGVAPLADDSWKHSRKSSIGAERVDVPTVLYRTTVTAMSYSRLIKAFAECLNKAGKPEKAVIVGRMRKRLTIMNTLITNYAVPNPKLA